MISFIKATSNTHFEQIADLASIIWKEHYTKLIGEEQVIYMLQTFQSTEAIKKQVIEHYEYYILAYNTKPVGYISIKEENSYLFLSKLYLLNRFRGKKIGKKDLFFIEERAIILGIKTIRLTVNRLNTNSIKAYEKMGFKTKGPLVTNIGNGFVMDDYEMIKTI